MKNTICP